MLLFSYVLDCLLGNNRDFVLKFKWFYCKVDFDVVYRLWILEMDKEENWCLVLLFIYWWRGSFSFENYWCKLYEFLEDCFEVVGSFV